MVVLLAASAPLFVFPFFLMGGSINEEDMQPPRSFSYSSIRRKARRAKVPPPPGHRKAREGGKQEAVCQNFYEKAKDEESCI